MNVMTLTEYWNQFAKIQQLNDIAFYLCIIGLFLVPIAFLFLVLKRKDVFVVAIAFFCVLEVIAITLLLSGSVMHMKLSNDWHHRDDFSKTSTFPTKKYTYEGLHGCINMTPELKYDVYNN